MYLNRKEVFILLLKYNFFSNCCRDFLKDDFFFIRGFSEVEICRYEFWNMIVIIIFNDKMLE